MSYLAYVASQTPWSEPRVEPQVIHDEEAIAYVERCGHITIVARAPLAEDEEWLPLEALARAHPWVKESQE